MKKRYLVALLVSLVVLTFAGRWVYFYRATYRQPAIPTIDPSQVAAAEVAYRAVGDEASKGTGCVLVDMTHASNLAVNDLAPLWSRLETRGVEVETLDGEDTSLAARLHEATALLVVAPTSEYAPEERDEIVAFVRDGGRLLLAADPTRPVPAKDGEEGDEPDLNAVFFPESAVPAINSIANAFGLVYFDDYLYNIHDNAGNYRNVKLRPAGDVHGLTRDLDTVVFYATHSLRGSGLALLSGDEHTSSSVRTGESGLAAVMLAAEGNVLALGDITCLTAPYHTMADNDRFLSRIADWLAVDGRQRDELEDFPYLFERPVDLVQVSGQRLPPKLIVKAADWQNAFERAGLTLDLRAEPGPLHDALLLGVYDDLERVQDILARAGVTITLAQEPGQDTDTAPSAPTAEPPLTVTGVTTGWPVVTPVITSSTLELADVGKMALEGTSLFVLDRGDERLAVLVLAESEPALVAAVERLVAHDLSGCVQADELTVCSSGEAQEKPAEEEEADKDDAAGPSGQTGKRILLVAIDTGDTKVHTGAEELEGILQEDYEVDIWSIDEKGPPEAGDLEPYDAYIFASGDRPATADDMEIFEAIEAGVEGGVMLIGEQPLPLEVEAEETGSISDLRVADGDHPLAKGFETGQVLTLLPLDKPVQTMAIPEVEFDVVFERGPDSPEAGTPAMVAGVDEGGTESRVIIATFAFYRLPEAARRTLALNAAAWLLVE
ncbi:MAG: DUF4350 domain-containing protein [Thermoflexales bacterium]|nr:DUF4350 domain-containing protein [Thermoflexales bacterium]